MSDDLTGKIALVTGAAGVLGEAVCRGLHADGLEVVLVDLDAARLEAIAASLGSRAHARACDVSDSDAVEALCTEVATTLGGIDVLVNNAGILSNNKAAATAASEWRKIMSVNLDGAFYFSHAVIEGMKQKQWGRIVNVCSLAAKTGGLTAGTAYTASKGGMEALTFSLARESARQGVTVNGIAPAYIKTPMVTEQLNEEQRQALLRDIPVGRFCEAEEVAGLIRYLVSPIAGFITGEIVDINGGLHMD